MEQAHPYSCNGGLIVVIGPVAENTQSRAYEYPWHDKITYWQNQWNKLVVLIQMVVSLSSLAMWE
jgi:hypothetical protein